MRNFGTELLDSLSLIKGNGSFVTSHQSGFIFPGLSVEGLGEIAYPINGLQAKALIQEAHKAPFGKGSQTILDDSVRSAWEIDAGKLHFSGSQWDRFLLKVTAIIKPQLGIEEVEVEVQLYKMLIYEKGDFFVSHRDSEKEKGMFGTLIIGVPSKHRGGELLVRFDGEEKSVSFAEPASSYKIPYVAFYADCEHEIKPLTEGYRVCLVYNLIQKKTDKAVRLEPLGEHVSQLASILKACEGSKVFSPGIVLLGHQYTPENFSTEQLKLNDRTRAEALIRAADNAGYYAKMCLVTSYLTGIPAPAGYGWDDEPDDDLEMEEVHDGWVSIEHWAEEGPPPLLKIEVDEDELLATFKLNEGDPIVKENSGYMGNYGPDLMFWYHYGAVIFWPKEAHEAMLLSQDLSNQLEWVGYYNNKRNQLSEREITTCQTILNSLLNTEGEAPKANYNVVADWLVGRGDEIYFEKLGYPLLLRFFQHIHPDFWAKLIETYAVNHFEKIFKGISQQRNISDMHHLLVILNALKETSSGRSLAESQTAVLAEYFSEVASGQQQTQLVNAAALSHLFELESTFPQQEKWVAAIAGILMENEQRSYINGVLTKVILNLEKKTNLSAALLTFTVANLQDRVNNKPQPPADWSRPMPNLPKNASRLWKILKEFLASPVDQIFDFRRNQSERNELEYAIRAVEVDLRTETIKKGSPHTLRIIKTLAAFEKQLKEWQEDVVLLEQVKKK
ncbi:2OG-Fe(II) oxygenase [Lunatibacter salilacus]|uniref:2OG-Fe(II) oxygenase n=1 Tax=Lunatibacter salilacus TaxID=2483804 RepID=UPI00131A850D|nr:2OG-Fe(II) oxygenase [Lunatibacter salilacus]